MHRALGEVGGLTSRSVLRYRKSLAADELPFEAYRREEISRGRVLELSKALRIRGDTLLRLAQVARGD